MIIALRPPDAAGPLRVGATGQAAVDTLRQLGVPLVLCRATGNRPGWGVHRPSGLFIGVYFDAHDHVGARPAPGVLATDHARNARRQGRRFFESVLLARPDYYDQAAGQRR